MLYHSQSHTGLDWGIVRCRCGGELSVTAMPPPALLRQPVSSSCPTPRAPTCSPPTCSPLQSDLEALERKQAQYNSMDKRASDLSKEVKILQEALADYNTVLDKVRRCEGRSQLHATSEGKRK